METSCLYGIWDRMSEYIEIVNCIYMCYLILMIILMMIMLMICEVKKCNFIEFRGNLRQFLVMWSSWLQMCVTQNITKLYSDSQACNDGVIRRWLIYGDSENCHKNLKMTIYQIMKKFLNYMEPGLNYGELHIVYRKLSLNYTELNLFCIEFNLNCIEFKLN